MSRSGDWEQEYLALLRRLMRIWRICVFDVDGGHLKIAEDFATPWRW